MPYLLHFICIMYYMLYYIILYYSRIAPDFILSHSIIVYYTILYIDDTNNANTIHYSLYVNRCVRISGILNPIIIQNLGCSLNIQ